jgi:hypothetical protein
MHRLFSVVFAVGIAAISAAQAMPAARLVPPPPGLTVPVASGCGLGVRRGPYDGCTPIYHAHGAYYRGYRRGYVRGYRDGYYDGPYVHYSDNGGAIAVDRGFCGFGSYLSCSQGLCWRFCY